MIKLSFKPKEVVKKILSELPERSRDVLIKRYGLGKETSKMTLEAIGKEYSITRERVRQIEEHGLNLIRKSEAYKDKEPIFSELRGVIDDLGVLIAEDELLDSISKADGVRNAVHFLLVVGDFFLKHKENEHFTHRWSVDKELALTVEESIKRIYNNLDKEDIISESELISNFLIEIKDISDKYKSEEIIKRWLKLSKKISSNPLGEWGKSESPNINVKGIRDYAFLVIRRHGSPIHFREVAEEIEKLFDKKAHVATTHNELIKDKRFVLVGRGLYALTDWGYSDGVVRDVIKQLLAKDGPLTKEDIVDRVLKERHVKENTVLVNLQNNKLFKKLSDDKYTLA
jgi:DNA-directed RNA polymerase delta subunit